MPKMFLFFSKGQNNGRLDTIRISEKEITGFAKTHYGEGYLIGDLFPDRDGLLFKRRRHLEDISGIAFALLKEEVIIIHHRRAPMKQRFVNIRILAGFLAIVLFLTVRTDWATTHVVQFGGSLGFAYSPANFSAKVGDTVKWEGDFVMHPLSSTTIPANAASWHMGSGTLFTYVITVAGTYNYHCDLHFSLGMTGSFTASESSVLQGATGANAARANTALFVDASVPGRSSISFFVPATGFVTLEVFDLLGHKMATLVNQIKEAGAYKVGLKAEINAHGYYFVKLSADGVEIVRTVRVLN
jgi:plastocyanin